MREARYFGLKYTREAFRDIEKLDPVVKKRVAQVIERSSHRPFFYAKKLAAPAAGQYRWRAGDYRIVFDIINKTIYILRIGHRREIYR